MDELNVIRSIFGSMRKVSYTLFSDRCKSVIPPVFNNSLRKISYRLFSSFLRQMSYCLFSTIPREKIHTTLVACRRFSEEKDIPSRTVLKLTRTFYFLSSDRYITFYFLFSNWRKMFYTLFSNRWRRLTDTCF